MLNFNFERFATHFPIGTGRFQPVKNVQRFLKKLLTLTGDSAKLVPHTVTSNNTNNTTK